MSGAILVQVVLALFQGLKGLGTGARLPTGTKTVTLNIAALLAWAAARWGLPISPEVIDILTPILITLMNLALRAVTKGPIAGGEGPTP